MQGEAEPLVARSGVQAEVPVPVDTLGQTTIGTRMVELGEVEILTLGIEG